MLVDVFSNIYKYALPQLVSQFSGLNPELRDSSLTPFNDALKRFFDDELFGKILEWVHES